MDGIKKLGGVCINQEGDVSFGEVAPLVAKCTKPPQLECQVDDSDFTANFDGEKWTVSWKWKGNEPLLSNQCAQYTIKENCKQQYINEIEQWIHDGRLVEHDEGVHGTVDGLIPLMAVFQPNKHRKVRPVMDYSRELNDYISFNPGQGVAICQKKLRKWRQMGNNVCMLDLQKAYLQLHVATDLQKFQARYCNKTFVMTRMRFGLNVALKIMSKILSRVLSLSETARKGTAHYIDDIIVNQDMVTVAEVRNHLQRYGLKTKESESIIDARVLGLRVIRQGSALMWLRDNDIIQEISKPDPVKGKWVVSKAKRATVWCDASSLAVGATVEIGVQQVEDGSWLRKDEGVHINVAELEAVIRGLGMAIKWGVTEIVLITDSATVYGWVKSIISDAKKPKVGGLGEMIISRRLSMISELVEVYQLSLEIQLVRSEDNIADKLTRVPKKWLKEKVCAAACTRAADSKIRDMLWNLHDTHHLGVDKTLYAAQAKCGQAVSRADVEQVVSECQVCKRVDPPPVKWEKGSLIVEDNWWRLATDITHYNGTAYLTVVDCGPSRFAIWRRLRNETSEAVVAELDQLFRERGSPVQLPSDNGPCYRSNKFSAFAKKWNLQHLFSCAHKASGNGIVERNHRTIKRMLARTGRSVQGMLYWYNHSPNFAKVEPAESLFNYQLRSLPDTATNSLRHAKTQLNPFKPGDIVYVKPVKSKCTTIWPTCRITALLSNTAAKVDEIPRHIADLRLCHRISPSNSASDAEVSIDLPYQLPPNDDNDIDSENENSANQEIVDHNEARVSHRERRPPQWLADFYVID
ncbi:uncharacterized protein [Watersipora subatra]|uniref:uncharacterized protein n=1 Tax=Watersipora subatra TaxID=2589382 RepID=UPI00355BBA77